MNFDPQQLLLILLGGISIIVSTITFAVLSKVVGNKLVLAGVAAVLGVAAGFFLAPPITVGIIRDRVNSDRPKDMVYAPDNLDRSKKYPLFLVLSPGGQPWSQMRALRDLAQRHQWILAGDEQYRNGVSLDDMVPHMVQTIRYAAANYPVDTARVYAGGVSGGAMGSYYLMYRHPEMVRGVIANTGMMPFGSDPPADSPVPADFPSDKNIVMIASPTDFRYQAMKKNRMELLAKRCKVQWIEFEGGHNLAPERTYEAAFAWLNQQK